MQKLETQTDYWLAQYQRLLDSKPQCLIDQVLPARSLAYLPTWADDMGMF